MKTISSREIRSKQMGFISVMDDVKELKTLPDLDVATIRMVADYLETSQSNVANYYNNHRKELEEYGIIKLNLKSFTDAGYIINPEREPNCSTVSKNGVSVRVYITGARCMSKTAVFNMALGINRSPVSEKIKAAVALAETENPGSTETDINNINEMENMTENVAENVLTFTNVEFGSIRVMEIDGQPWFVGKDVAESLGYANTKDAIKTHVDIEDKKIIQKSYFPTLEIPNRGMTTINESGLYSLIMSSKLPTAKQFKRWVTSEVLPSVRNNGGYIAKQEELTDAELMAKALLVAKKQIDERNKKIEEQSQTIAGLSEEINTWDKRSVINALIRSYAGQCFNGDFKKAFIDFYRQFDYKYHTKLNSRKVAAGGKKSIMDYMSDGEISNALKLAIAICESRNIDTGLIINETNLATYGV